MKVAVIIPTITGREESLARTMQAYWRGENCVLHVVKDQPSWPAACNIGTDWALGLGFDAVHYGADDLVPQPGWLEPCLPVLEAGELPAAQVWNYTKEGPAWNATDADADGFAGFTRVPILTRAMAEAIGPWPEWIYYSDCWVSDAGRALGWPTRMVGGYDFVHYWVQIGRLDGDPTAMERARRQYLDEGSDYIARMPGFATRHDAAPDETVSPWTKTPPG